MATHPTVMCLTLQHIQHTHSQHISTSTQATTNDKSTHGNGMGNQNETLMATYKAIVRPTMDSTSSIWSVLASSISINKLQVMWNVALRIATRCTQDTEIQLCMTKPPYFLQTRVMRVGRQQQQPYCAWRRQGQ